MPPSVGIKRIKLSSEVLKWIPVELNDVVVSASCVLIRLHGHLFLVAVLLRIVVLLLLIQLSPLSVLVVELALALYGLLVKHVVDFIVDVPVFIFLSVVARVIV